MIIHVINRQNIRRPNNSKIKAALCFFLLKAAPETGGRHWSEVSLLLADDEYIRKIKRQFFDIDCVTDVISFSSFPRPAGDKCRAAEIAVNVERACLEGGRRGGLDHEFALYLAHGCDHLAGHGDRTIKARQRMRRRELRWLGQATELNLLTGMFRPAQNTPCDRQAPRG